MLLHNRIYPNLDDHQEIGKHYLQRRQKGLILKLFREPLPPVNNKNNTGKDFEEKTHRRVYLNSQEKM